MYGKRVRRGQGGSPPLHQMNHGSAKSLLGLKLSTVSTFDSTSTDNYVRPPFCVYIPTCFKTVSSFAVRLMYIKVPWHDIQMLDVEKAFDIHLLRYICMYIYTFYKKK